MKKRALSSPVGCSKFKNSSDSVFDPAPVDSIELKTGPVWNVPHLSGGGALVTLTAFYKKTRQTTGDRVKRDFYGRFHGRPNPPNLFGRGYKDLASRLFPGIESDEQVLMRHTLVGFYGRILTARDRSAWLLDLASYKNTTNEYLDSRICGPLSVATKENSPLRFCPGCVEADLNDLGMAEWKVLHQLPFLTHCAEHGQLLLSSCQECARCLVSRSDIYLLPSDPCPKCGARPARSDSEMRRGQLLLGHLCTRIFKGEVPEVGPDHWPVFVHSIVKRLGGIGHATTRLHALLVRLWSVDSVQGISKLVGANLPKNFVELELTLQMNPRMWLPRLIMLSAYESELSDGANVSAFQVDEVWDEATDDILKTLYATAAHQGVPRGIVARLLDGESFTRVRGVSTVTLGKFDSFRQALPVDALQLLTGLLPVSKTPC